MEEQRPSKAKVTGSSPVSCTIFKKYTKIFDLFYKITKLDIQNKWVISSVGESICLTSRGS